ncbi:MAG: M24 family metallopeptidase [Hyphomicrobiales bacterium]
MAFDGEAREKRFQEKRNPLLHPGERKNKDLEPGFDFLKSEMALRALADRDMLDAVALVPGANFVHVYGHGFHQNERCLMVIIQRQGPNLAIVPALEAASFDRIGFAGEVFFWRDNDGPTQAISEAAARLQNVRRLGVEGQRMRVMEHHQLKNALPDLEIIDCHAAISSTLRLHKSAADIARLSRAIEISEIALEQTLQSVSAGQTEMQVQNVLLANLFAAGAQGLSFTPIVAAGANSHRPHASARTDYAIKPGDALLLDFGATYEGFCADITRTVFVDSCDDRGRAQYGVVLAANTAGREAARPGITCDALDRRVLGVLEASPFAQFVRTKTGHGLGRDVHEDPYIMVGNTQVLEPGMVFTIEPGLYVPGVAGVRIEDDVVITADGAQSLTSFPRDLRIVGQEN